MDRPERSRTPAVIQGEPGWDFVVYADGSYTLISPQGQNVPPMGLLPPADIDALRQGGNLSKED